MLRQKYVLTNLIQLAQFTLHKSATHNHFKGFNRNYYETIYPTSVDGESMNDEVALLTQDDINQCPSTWHALSDRHSPIVPSSHVTHKMTQRDKQRQFTEYKRKLKLERKCNFNSRLSELDKIHPDMLRDGNHYANFKYHNEMTGGGRPSCIYPYGQRSNYVPSSDRDPELCTFYPRQQSCADYSNNVRLQVHYFNCGFDYINAGNSPSSLQYNLPLSPPITPDHLKTKTSRMHNTICTNACNYTYPDEGYNYDSIATHIKQERDSNVDKPSSVVNHYNTPYMPQCVNVPFHSHANIKMSMICDNSQLKYSSGYTDNRLASEMHYFINNINNYSRIVLPKGHFNDIQYRTPQAEVDVPKNGQNVEHSCAIADGCPSNGNSVVKYDIEASVHMKIVEVDNSSQEHRQDVDLPAIGSFLEYLNENESTSILSKDTFN